MQLITGKSLHPQSMMPAAPPAHAKAGSKAPANEAQFHGIQRQGVPYASPVPALKATRPVYPYPYIAVYTGHGSTNDAANYKPVKSEAFAKVIFGNEANALIGPDNQKN